MGQTMQEEFKKFVQNEIDVLPDMCKHLSTEYMVRLCFIVAAD